MYKILTVGLNIVEITTNCTVLMQTIPHGIVNAYTMARGEPFTICPGGLK